MKPRYKALLFICSLLLTSSLFAQTETYRARLSPMPRTPQTVDSITGQGEVILTLNGKTLTVTGTFSGMSSAATMAHIHNGPPAQPGPVAHRLEVTAAPAGEVTATLELTDEQVTALKKNEFYVQIHSANNAGGELRGWIYLRS